MIKGLRGAHILIYSSKPDVDRTFFRDVRGFTYVTVRLPSGGEIGLYQPTHETAI